MTGEKYFVQNFGCRAAQADGAAIESALRARGLTPAATRVAADVVVVNTCTVTAGADEDARQSIRRTHRENPAARPLAIVSGPHCSMRRKRSIPSPSYSFSPPIVRSTFAAFCARRSNLAESFFQIATLMPLGLTREQDVGFHRN